MRVNGSVTMGRTGINRERDIRGTGGCDYLLIMTMRGSVGRTYTPEKEKRKKEKAGSVIQ